MTPHGHRWRTVTLPALRVRAGHECQRCAAPEQPMGLYRMLEGAHLDGDDVNDGDDNLALLCRRCHRAHDYARWAEKFGAWLRAERERRAERKDAERPILAMLMEGS